MASEKRCVRCYDIPSAFVNMDIDENMLMVVNGKLVEMMVHIAPQIYRKYITLDRKGMPMLYMKLQKALYGLMRVRLLFYRKLCKELEEYGFMVNPYDQCVANKCMGDGELCVLLGCGGRMPKPSACVFVHGVGMMPMRLVGGSSQHRPWWGPKPLHVMVAGKNEKSFCSRSCFFPGTILHRIG